jgi:hypothetical protein
MTRRTAILGHGTINLFNANEIRRDMGRDEMIHVKERGN